MEDNLVRAKVHAAVLQHCAASGVQPDPALARRVLAAAHEEKNRTVKSKKKWLVLAVLAAILLSTTIGLAWSLSRGYFTDIANITLTSGDYENWSLAQKRYMMTIMGKYGLVSESKAAWLSRRSEKEIDAFMLERYGTQSGSEGLGAISLTRIAWVEMGPYTDWDNETWVWYSQMMFDIGLWNENSDVDVYETPGEEAVSPAEAVTLAEAHLVSQGYDPQAVKGAWRVWHYMTHASDVNRQDMVYLITFRFADGSETYVFLTPEGALR